MMTECRPASSTFLESADTLITAPGTALTNEGAVEIESVSL